MPKLPIGDIGPVEVVWDHSGTPLNLSPFLGDIKLTREDSISKVFEEAFGDAPVDAVFAGSVMELEMPLTRSELTQLETILPGAALTTNALKLTNLCGSSMYANAKPVYIKPVVNGVVSTTKSSWIELYKVHPYNAWELSFARDGQRVFLVKCLIFPCMESGVEGEFGTVGVNT
jgi:hypothetical protein